MLGGIGPPEIILIIVALALIFGAKRIPEIGANLGKGIRNFKNSFTEAEESEDKKRLEEGSEKEDK